MIKYFSELSKKASFFNKNEVWQTSYGKAVVIWADNKGAAKFRILEVSPEAKKAGWKTGANFIANEKDNTDPSTTSWVKLEEQAPKVDDFGKTSSDFGQQGQRPKL